MASSIITNNFPATQQEIYETTFKTRFRDKSILPRITNRNYEGKFRKKGTTINVPILPIIETHKTRVGEKVKYQEPKSASEKFTINRERYFAFKLEDEDKLFSALDLESPLITEANRQMAEDVEIVGGIGFGGVVELCNDLFEGIFAIFSINIFNQFLPGHLLEGAGRNGC